MPTVIDTLRINAAYAYLAVGAIWLVVAFLVGSYLVLWPVIALIAGGILMKSRPEARLSWAWASSAAVLGLLLSGWQVYSASTLVTGSFAAVASVSVAVFGVLAVVHLVLLYLSNSSKPEPR